MSRKKNKNERIFLVQYLVTLLVTILCLAFLIWYSFDGFYNLAKEDAVQIGQSSVGKKSGQIRNYLLKKKSLLEVAAGALDYELSRGDSLDAVEEMIKSMAESFSRENDEPAGLYGVLKGRFVNTDGWIPPESSSVLDFPWYQNAVKAKGKVVYQNVRENFSPNGYPFSFSKRLSDHQSVLAVGWNMDEFFRDLVSTNSKAEGWLVLDSNGMGFEISEGPLQGRNLLSSEYWGTDHEKIAREILHADKKNLGYVVADKRYHLFLEPVLDCWYVVKWYDESVLFEKARWIAARNIMVSVVLFLFVGFFCTAVFRSRLKLARSNREQSRFLTGLSSEMQSPINGILGLNSIILRDTDDENIKEYAENIQNAGQTLLSMVDDIKDFSKIENGEIKLAFAEYELFNVLEDCFNENASKAAAKNLKFTLECNPEIPSVLWGDGVRIRQIINSLLCDAIRCTEYGEVGLSVNFDIVPNDNPLKVENYILLQLVVRDTETGISSKNASSNFSEIRPSDLSEDRGMDARSLGLNLTRKLVLMNGGNITVKSRYGEETSFIVTIPQLVLNVEPLGDFAMRFHQMQNMKRNSEKIYAPEARVLVVDSVALNLKVFCGLLKDTKVKIDVAINEAQYRKMLWERHYDIVFMDCKIPLMEDKKNFNHLKNLDGPNKNTPLILLMSDTFQKSEENYLEWGFSDFLSTPLKELDLIRVLKQYLPKALVLTSDDLLDENVTEPSHEGRL